MSGPGERHSSGLREALRSRLFWLLLIGLLASKLVALFTFGHWTESDESVVGIMAKHILEQGVHPLYYYGQDYAGGASIEAHTAALFYRLFGMSEYSLKLAALVYTLAGGVLLYLLAVRLVDRRTGLCALFIYTTMPALIEWGLKTRGGYVTMLPLIPAMLWMADRMLRRDRIDHLAAIGMIVLAGVGAWNMQSILLLVMTIAAFVCGYWLWRRRLPLAGGYLAYAVVAACGVVWWRRHDGSGVTSTVLGIQPGSLVHEVFRELPRVLTKLLPDLFQPFINDEVEGLSWPAPITFGLFIAALALVSWRVARKPSGVNPTVVLMLLFVPVYLLCSAVASVRIVVAPRHLFPLLPVIAIIGGLAMTRIPGWARASIVGYLAAAFIFLNTGMIRHPQLYEHSIFYDPADIRDLAQTLERLNIRYVQTTYVLEWRLLFETQERVIAVNIAPFVRYPPYAQMLAQAMTQPGTKVAYVFEKDGHWSRKFLGRSPQEFAQYLTADGVLYQLVETGQYQVFILQTG